MKNILITINGHLFTAKHRLPLINGLIANGHNLKCVVPKDSEAMKELVENNINIIEWNISRRGLNPFSGIISIFQLVKIYRSESPDIVINATIKPVLYGTFAAYFIKVRSVINIITGLGSIFISKVWYNSIIKSFILILYKMVFSLVKQTVIFQNPDDKNILINKNYKFVNAVIIKGSGVNIKDFPFHQLPRKKRITFIGRVIREKGIESFISAMKIIQKERKDINFTIAGPLDIGNPSYISESTMKHWQNLFNVEWWSENQYISDVYKKSSIIVLPSQREGLPKTLLEAGLSGRPVIASDVPGCKDVVLNGTTGYLFPLENHKKFASYILSLIDNYDEMKKMGVAARQHIIENFSDEVIVPKLVFEIEK